MKLKEFLKKTHGLLALFAVIALLCSFFAAIVNTSGFSVKVTKITADMDAFYEAHPAIDNPVSSRRTDGVYNKIDAKLVGNLYMPKGVDKDHPAPLVILTHGYLNSKEFEEAPAIEMSRRGYVVFAFDQYDHGESTWDTSKTGSFSFFMHSVFDAVQYMYEQPYVLKAADGTGMISVSGHSMGGFSSEAASVADGMGAMFGGTQKICACLAVGADWMYLGGTSLMPFLGSKTCGTIAGVYDEFFFDTASEGTGETVREKHYLQDPTGIAFLGKEGAKSGEFVPNSGGERVIYEVKGDHPYNTWSPEATKCMIEFYDHAFEYQANLHGATLPEFKEIKGQSWWLKDVFTCIGMLAFVAVIICLALTLVKLPFFKGVVTPAEEITAVEPTSLVRRIVGIVCSVVSCVLGVIYIPAFMDMNKDLAQVQTIGLVFAIAGAVVAVAALVYKLVVKEPKCKGLAEVAENATYGGFLIAAVALALRWFAGDGTRLFSNSSYFTADSITVVVYWAIGSGLLGLLFTLASHFFVKKGRNAGHLGLKANLKQIVTALITAIVVVGAARLLLAVSDWVFGVDYRVYIYAFRPATKHSMVAALRYMPFFFIFYLCAGIAVANGAQGLDGWKADLHTAGVSVLPVVIFMIVAYSSQMIKGVSVWPTFALNVIVVQNLVWTLIFLAVIQRRTLKATGNIWTGVFINTIWFTIITLASTCIYLF